MVLTLNKGSQHCYYKVNYYLGAPDELPTYFTGHRLDADEVALKAKRILAGSPEARLSVLHIVEDDMVRFGFELVPASSLSGDFDGEHWQEARTKLAQFLERNELNAVNSEVTAAISNSKGIVNYCREKEVDLLIIGRHERRGIAAWLVKATADSILPNVPCDSLVVKLDQPVPK